MPSGAKKRKAAKKKKEKEAIDNSQGYDDLKTLDERESDGGEVSSPVSQEDPNHHHPHPFIEGVEEEKRDTSSVRPFVSENKSMEGVSNDGKDTQEIVAENEGVEEIDWEVKSDEDSENKTVSIEYVNSVKESHDGSSSSSSSDNESQDVEKNSEVESVKSKEEAYKPVLETAPFDVSVKQVVSLSEEATTITEDAQVGVNGNSVVETIPVRDSVKPIVYLSEEVIHVTESAPVENSANSDVGNSSSSSSDNELQDVEKNLEVVESVKLKEEAYDPVSETAPFDDSAKKAVSLSEEVTTITEDPSVGMNGNSVVETISVDDSVKPIVLLSEEAIHVSESAPVERSVNSDVVELGSKENIEKILPSLDENTRVSLAETDLELKKNEDKVVLLLVENGGTSSSTMGFASKENGDKLLQSSNAPSVETRNGAERINDSEIPESSENQPLVSSAPRMVETSSWKSCCGLFEVLTGR